MDVWLFAWVVGAFLEVLVTWLVMWLVSGKSELLKLCGGVMLLWGMTRQWSIASTAGAYLQYSSQ